LLFCSKFWWFFPSLFQHLCFVQCPLMATWWWFEGNEKSFTFHWTLIVMATWWKCSFFHLSDFQWWNDGTFIFLGCVSQVNGICIMLPMVVKNLESWTSMHFFFCKLILQTNMYWSLTFMCEVSTSWSFKEIHIKVQLQIVKHLTTTRYSLFGECFFFFYEVSLWFFVW
jgi:hypothetical protein